MMKQALFLIAVAGMFTNLALQALTPAVAAPVHASVGTGTEQLILRSRSLHPYTYAGQDPLNRVDPTGLLYCGAPQPGCADWVMDALAAIESVPVPIGKQLVQTLKAKESDIQLLQKVWASGTPQFLAASEYQTNGFGIIFTNHFPAFSQQFDMATRPSRIYVKLRYFQPPHTPAGNDVLLLAHELVHVRQGSAQSASVLGEVEAYQAQALLRPLLHPGSNSTSYEKEAVTIDLTDPAIRTDLQRWLRLRKELEAFRMRFEDLYGLVPLFPIVSNPYPPPDPEMIPPGHAPEPPKLGTPEP